jgi:hypothetical protein
MKKLYFCFCICALMLTSTTNGQEQKKGKNWWSKYTTSSGWRPSQREPKFEDYFEIQSNIVREGADGKSHSDTIVTKGWDKTLQTFYISFVTKEDSPVRLCFPEIPSTLSVRNTPMLSKILDPKMLHTHAKIVAFEEKKKANECLLVSLIGKVGMALGSSGSMDYIAGLPGTLFDISRLGNVGQYLIFADKKWTPVGTGPAYILIKTNQILTMNVRTEEIH